VGGNGGTQPKHAELLATGIDEDTCIKYIDRYLMFYVATADRLERTARWQERLEGGIEYLKDVIINDKLGICDELDRQMQHIVDTYQDEWATVVADPERRKAFKQFVNSDETERGIGMIQDREQFRPVDWPRDDIPLALSPLAAELKKATENSKKWVKVGAVKDFPKNGGATIKYGKSQIAVFRFETRNEWYATQNVCPHKRALVLSQGIIGSKDGIPKVACPLHKKNFDLRNGECFDSDHEDMKLLTFPVKIDEGEVWLHLPPTHQLDEVLDTNKVRFNSDCLEPTSAAFTPFAGEATKLKVPAQPKTPAYMKMDLEL
jgi:NAD(P)H-dependent nitrite reductase small subunit